MKWRVLNTGINSAAYNMAVDEAVLHAHANGQAAPTIRFYGWQPAAISLGYFQKARTEIDIDQCRRQGIDVVRRLTGGRAVLHDAELTYSIVVSEDFPLIPQTITASYHYFSQGLLAGMKKLGINAKMTIPTAAYGQTRRRQTSAACFDSPSHYEITVEGRKLVGSAQVRKNGVILQHGSILLTFNPAQIAGLLNLQSAEARDKAASMLAARATSLSEAANREIGWDEACEQIMQAFGLALGIEVEQADLSLAEQEAAKALISEKYSNDSWNFLR